jgi:starvation-inducible outer membrane lipoprotein
MKKLILIALAAVVMAGCNAIPDDIKGSPTFDPNTDYSDWVTVVYIDGCEYYKNSVRGGYVFTHKGNCKFCEQRRKAEIRKIVELLKDK